MKGRNLILMIFYLQGMKLSDVSDSCPADIRKLTMEGKCTSISHGGSKQLQWKECLEELSKHVNKECKGHGEEILFCENGGSLTCCFSNVKCAEDHEDGDEDNFSTGCLREKEITELDKKGNCATISHGRSEHLQWERCMEQLSKDLDVRCEGMGLEQVKMLNVLCLKRVELKYFVLFLFPTFRYKFLLEVHQVRRWKPNQNWHQISTFVKKEEI